MLRSNQFEGDAILPFKTPSESNLKRGPEQRLNLFHQE